MFGTSQNSGSQSCADSEGFSVDDSCHFILRDVSVYTGKDPLPPAFESTPHVLAIVQCAAIGGSVYELYASLSTEIRDVVRFMCCMVIADYGKGVVVKSSILLKLVKKCKDIIGICRPGHRIIPMWWLAKHPSNSAYNGPASPTTRLVS